MDRRARSPRKRGAKCKALPRVTNSRWEHRQSYRVAFRTRALGATREWRCQRLSDTAHSTNAFIRTRVPAAPPIPRVILFPSFKATPMVAIYHSNQDLNAKSRPIHKCVQLCTYLP